VFIEAKDDGGGSGNWTTGAISRAKAPVKSSSPTSSFFYRPDALPVTQPTVSSTEGKTSHSMDLFTPSLPWSSNFVFDH